MCTPSRDNRYFFVGLMRSKAIGSATIPSKLGDAIVTMRNCSEIQHGQPMRYGEMITRTDRIIGILLDPSEEYSHTRNRYPLQDKIAKYSVEKGIPRVPNSRESAEIVNSALRCRNPRIRTWVHTCLCASTDRCTDDRWGCRTVHSCHTAHSQNVCVLAYAVQSLWPGSCAAKVNV